MADGQKPGCAVNFLPKIVHIPRRSHVVVCTGAGISAESGVPTFRGSGGLWEGHRVEEVATPDGFRRDPALVWRFYGERRRAMIGIRPNAAHEALAALEKELGDRFLLVTQNVDGLHRAAGSQRVVEIHGSLHRSRCSRDCSPPFPDTRTHLDEPTPCCDRCGAYLRPDVVWFGESLDEELIDRTMAALERCDFYIAIGTSGAVRPVAMFPSTVSLLRGAKAVCVLVNAEPPENERLFQWCYYGLAGDLVPKIFRVHD